MTFWEIEVGLWSTAHFVSNSGGSRGGAWEAWATLLFLDQTDAAPEGPKKFFGDRPLPSLSQGLDDRAPVPPTPPISEGLDPPLHNNIATTHLCL